VFLGSCHLRASLFHASNFPRAVDAAIWNSQEHGDLLDFLFAHSLRKNSTGTVVARGARNFVLLPFMTSLSFCLSVSYRVEIGPMITE
jgi:hypothetical protein